jgi:MYXO-CTERM domain-containing protein
MRLKHLVATLLLAGTSASFGATGFFGGLYFVTSLNGGPNVFNQITSGTTPGAGAATGHSLTSDGFNPQFGSFGTFNLSDSLALKGFEYKTFNDNGSNVTFANLFYRIYQGSPSGAFQQVQTNTPISNVGNNKTWQVTNGTTNLLNGLTPGNYTVQIYTESYTNAVNTAGNIFGFTAGAGNPTATFTVVPEPSAALLGGLGALALMRRRRI